MRIFCVAAIINLYRKKGEGREQKVRGQQKVGRKQKQSGVIITPIDTREGGE